MNANEVIRLTAATGFALLAGMFIVDVAGKRINEHKAIKLRAELLTTYMTTNLLDEEEADDIVTEIMNEINNK